MLKPLAFLIVLALPVQADEPAPVLADYWTNSGSLPPEYAWETSVLIREDGQLELKHCRGYETEGPACKQRKAKVPATALEAIRTAATDSGLLEEPARETDAPVVGGGMTWGHVYLPGGTVELLSQPAEADVQRVGKVLAAIAAAIPPRFERFTDPD
ncbi:MAG: hypothetical protein ACK4IU_13095 [Tabrizicola flagellatus]|jgi:hypothetical protein|uniref:hypothetical protein n=1 Tax=Tabrizicola flagellatus TaxID=2593021 RepID=UPI00391DE3CD